MRRQASLVTSVGLVVASCGSTAAPSPTSITSPLASDTARSPTASTVALHPAVSIDPPGAPIDQSRSIGLSRFARKVEVTIRASTIG